MLSAVVTLLSFGGLLWALSRGFRLPQPCCSKLGIPREIASRFPPRLRELVGYGVYWDLIGHIESGSPAALLDAAVESTMVWDRHRASHLHGQPAEPSADRHGERSREPALR